MSELKDLTIQLQASHACFEDAHSVYVGVEEAFNRAAEKRRNARGDRLAVIKELETVLKGLKRER